MYAVGLMSGTSLDGVDAVLCEITDSSLSTNIKTISFLTYPIAEAIKDKIRLCCANEAHVADVCSLNFELGELFAKAAIAVCEKANIKSEELGFIASHGQTIYHQPRNDDKFVASTLQIGETAMIAQRCGCPVIGNFRVKDMAAGGEGAPLVPFSEFILYREEDYSVALQNIGGIGNVTVLPKRCGIEDVTAFDTGPGNMIIDEAMRQLYQKPYDDGGRIGAQGKLIEAMCEELKAHPYLDMTPPKSTGREMFGEDFTKHLLATYKQERKEDIIATTTWFTAYSIANSYQRFVLPKHEVKEVILAGGGAHNKTLQTMLQEMLPQVRVCTQEDKGFSSDAKEAIAFVILGNETMHHQFSNVPNATGATEKVILGNITYPY